MGFRTRYARFDCEKVGKVVVEPLPINLKSVTVEADRQYIDSDHTGERTETAFDFDEGTVVRSRRTDGNHINYQNAYATFRARYATDNTFISNTAGIQGSWQPHNYSNFLTSYSPQIYPADIEKSITDNSSVSPSWEGYFRFILPREWMLIISPKANYAYNSNRYTYHADGVAPVVNEAAEKAWNSFVSIGASKRWGRNTLSVWANGEFKGNHLKYSGSNPATVNVTEQAAGVRVEAATAFWKARLNASAKCYLSHTDFAGYHYNEWLPSYFISGGITFNPKMSLHVSSELSNWTNSVSARSDNIVVRDRFEAVKGNRKLKTFLFTSASAYFNYYPTQNLSFSSFFRYQGFDKPIVASYSQTEIDGRTMMLQSYIKDGTFRHLRYGITGTLRLLGNSLTLRASITGNNAMRRGLVYFNDNYVNFNVNAWYYIRDFYFGAYYAIRTRDTRTHFRTVSPSYYSFTAGWSHNDLNISIQAGSPFRSGREAGRMVEVAPRYHSEQTSYIRYYHRTFNLSLTYTIPYGKKVERDEDLQRGSSPQSGIVK